MPNQSGEYLFEPVFSESTIVYTNIHSFYIHDGVIYGVYPDGSEKSVGTVYTYFYCETPAAVSPKIVTQDTSIEGYKRFKISKHAWFLIRFKESNTHGQPYLTVNGQGPYRIFYNGRQIGENSIQKNVYYMMVYEQDPTTGLYGFNIVGNIEVGRNANSTVGFNSSVNGNNVIASGDFSHAEGDNTQAIAQSSHTEGLCTIATKEAQHVQGKYNVEDVTNNYLDIVGNGTENERSNAFALDSFGTGRYKGDLYVNTNADSTGGKKVATEEYVQYHSDALIYKGVVNSYADLPIKHERGWTYKVGTDGTYGTHICEVGDVLICNTDGTQADETHWDAVQAGDGSVIGPSSVTDNAVVLFDGTNGKVVKNSIVTISSTGAISNGRKSNTAAGEKSIAIGSAVEASGNMSHAEGNTTLASGIASHAEGYYAQANGNYSHAEGEYTKAIGQSQSVKGKYNVVDESATQENIYGTYAEIIGNGTADNARSNARTLDWNGNEILAGKLTIGTTPTADMDVVTKKYADDALALKADLDSPALTGIPTAPTADTSTENIQIATTEYVKNKIESMLDVADAMMFKGTIGSNGTVTTLPADHKAGWTYKVITAATYAGNVCEFGDLIICIKDGITANNADWTAVQSNMDGIVTGPANSVDGNVAIFDGASGKTIKDGGTIQSLIIDDLAGNGITNKVWSADKITNQLSLKVDKTITVNGHALSTNVDVTKSDVGLGNCNNTSDADKPISNATQSALDAKVPTSRKINGYALDSDISLSKSDVGLDNCNNTSDADKPVSNATQVALDLKAPLASPTFTGTPKSVTPTNTSDNTMIATKGYVDNLISVYIPAPPENDGEYVLTCTVENSEVSYAWVEKEGE